MAYETIWAVFFAIIMAILAVVQLVSIRKMNSLNQKLKQKEKDCDDLINENVGLAIKLSQLNANHLQLREVAEANSKIHKQNKKEFESRRFAAPAKIGFWLAFFLISSRG